ncbi:hypothetical protein BKM31_35685 [[Actinomadura] parvosata subsp. kistnae]|uniref:Uncharacterized protein n=1 Tax=[Actinomadura] parvosata subsp. kistnae TaxID=1909395 RepID=A0A1V0A7B1_9ACTN|nr:hypothetical protein BKM31_35685 [Nonomuraea sp. ATCC 55076]
MLGKSFGNTFTAATGHLRGFQNALTKIRLRVGQSLDLVHLRETETGPATRVSRDMSDRLLVEKQPGLSHSYGNYWNARVRVSHALDGLSHLLLTSLHARVVRVAVHHDDVGLQPAHEPDARFDTRRDVLTDLAQTFEIRRAQPQRDTPGSEEGLDDTGKRRIGTALRDKDARIYISPHISKSTGSWI